jgi:hypothetical protein
MWPPWVALGRQGAHIGAPLQILYGAVVILLFLARPAFSTTPPVRVLSTTGIGVESAALLMSGQEGGEIPLGVLALPIRGDGGTTRVLFRLRMVGPALLAGQTGDTLRVEVCLYALGASGGVQAALLETIEVDLASLRESAERDGVDLLGSLTLKPGQHSVRMLARNLETGRLGVRTLPLAVPAPESLEATPVLSPPPAEGDPRVTARSSSLGPFDPPPFPDDAAGPALAAAAPVPQAPPPSIPDTVEGRRLRSEIRAAYRDVLARLAAGREAEALASLAALEDALLSRPGEPVGVEGLVEIELAAGRELAAANPESLVPVLRFHQRLHGEASVKRRLQGSTVAREAFTRLVDVYAEAGRPEMARRFRSTFGVALLLVGVRSRGEQMLLQVLADDAGDEIVRLVLAADAARFGARDEVSGHLEALLAAHPDHPEGRLRRALNLARQRRTAEADAALREVIQEETDLGRLSLAYQELARLLVAAGHPGVERLLRDGLARLPGDEKLTLLLAAALERSGLRGEARRLLAGFKPEASDGGGAARHRFNLLPDEPVAAALAELDRETAAHLPDLAAALARTAK